MQEILDDLVECLGQLMSRSQVSPTIAAQKKSFVTYTMPIIMEHAPVIITLEARALLASSGTTGLRTWEAALRLATFLSIEEGTQLVKNKNIIELGAGTGLLSILCTKYLGSKFVLATDGSGEVVDDMATNVFINGLEDSDKLETAGLAWGHALVDGVEQRFDGDRKLDIILGADLVRVFLYKIIQIIPPLRISFCTVKTSLSYRIWKKWNCLTLGLAISYRLMIKGPSCLSSQQSRTYSPCIPKRRLSFLLLYEMMKP